MLLYDIGMDYIYWVENFIEWLAWDGDAFTVNHLSLFAKSKTLT